MCQLFHKLYRLEGFVGFDGNIPISVYWQRTVGKKQRTELGVGVADLTYGITEGIPGIVQFLGCV